MLKKILIAAVAVVAGLVVVNRSSFVRVMWTDAKSCMERQIPPEVQLKQLASEIDKIDADIKRNISKLAAQEVSVNALEERLTAMKNRQKTLRGDVEAMRQNLEGARTEKVSFKGHAYPKTELTRRLDMSLTDFTNLKDQVKSQELLLADKRRTLEAAHARISEMRNKKEQFRLVAAQLETKLEQLKTQQMASHLDLDDSQIARCNELVQKIKTRLATDELTARILHDYGYNTTTAPVVAPDQNSTEEVLKAARQALDDEKEPNEKVSADNNNQ
jgi:chromosome segregation ATPase